MAWRSGALWIGGTLAVLALGGLLFAASGIYNVAARVGHFEITRLLIEMALRRSVALHSRFVEVPPLDDADRIRLGAAHFQAGCAPCHGAPGQPRNPIVLHMLPSPPNLAHAVETWSDRELFWIVKNGLKYTGMPAWSAPARDDEVWTVVAFLHRLPAIEAEEYRALAGGAGDRPAGATQDGSWSADLVACTRCHDDAGRAPAGQLVPKLAGQSARYLATALRAYAESRRPSGIMQPVAAALDEAAITRLAEYYASLPGTGGAVSSAPPEQVARGRSIAMSGVPDDGIPPCLTCHASGFAAYPRITGQSATYIRQQLHLWQAGLREGTVLGQVMAPIAKRLTQAQIEDVAAYLETLETGYRLERGSR